MQAAAAAAPTLIHKLASIVDRLDLSQLFPAPAPLEVELGSGDGSFLVNYARLHPDHNFLGVERLLGRLRKLDLKSRRAGLPNIASRLTPLPPSTSIAPIRGTSASNAKTASLTRAPPRSPTARWFPMAAFT